MTLTRTLFFGFLMAALTLTLGCAEDEEPADGNGGGPACAANTRFCLDTANFQVCRPDGSGFDFGTCPTGQPCMGGLCSGGMNPDPNPGQNPDPGPGQNPDPGPGPGPGVNPDPNPGNNPDPNPSFDPDPNPDQRMGPCDPFFRECLSPTLLRQCRPDGASYDLGTCREDQPCRDGYCDDGTGVPGTCSPNTRNCLDANTVRSCRPDGTAFDFVFCPSGQVCDGGDCRPLGDCTDVDRDGYGEGPDCLGPDCDDNNFSINPFGSEICGNNIDEDCQLGDAPCDCDPLTQDCPGDRLMCSLGRGGDFECRTEGVLGEGELCGGIPSNCQRGLECLITGDDNRSRCIRLCDADQRDACIGDSFCGAFITDHEDVGLCVGATRCDPVDNPGACPNGTACQPISERDSLCFDSNGTSTENQTCNPNGDDCASGFLCITQQGGDNPGSRCKALCRPARGNADCGRHQGDACTPIDLSFTFNGRTEQIRSYGICD